MSRLNQSKLNYLLTHSQTDVVLTSQFLAEKGYYKQLIKCYCDNKWLVPVGRGAYTRLNDQLIWQGAVNALQKQLLLPLHVGGLTALQINGIAQYICVDQKNGDRGFYLYNTTFQSIRLPKWFQQAFRDCHVEHKKLFNGQEGISERLVGNILLLVSTPERAILEIVSLAPNTITFSHVNELIESLHGLRSQVVQKLLENCFSVKVKRLFLYLAEKNNLPCFHEINLEKINLGSGKRVIGEGGKYNAKWQLSLPVIDDFDSWDESDE